MIPVEAPPATVSPTIALPNGCEPWKACSDDHSRPVICHGYLRQHDGAWWLLTTDSYIACALKVRTSGDVREGFVPREAMEAMAEVRPVPQAEQINDRAWKVSVGDGHATFDLSSLVAPKGYPDLAKLGMWDYEPGAPLGAIGLDPRLTVRLSQALGFESPLRGIALEFTSYKGKPPTESAIRVTGGAHFRDRIGLQMPVSLDTA